MCSSESSVFGELNAFEKATATSCDSLRRILHLAHNYFAFAQMKGTSDSLGTNSTVSLATGQMLFATDSGSDGGREGVFQFKYEPK